MWREKNATARRERDRADTSPKPFKAHLHVNSKSLNRCSYQVRGNVQHHAQGHFNERSCKVKQPESDCSFSCFN